MIGFTKHSTDESVSNIWYLSVLSGVYSVIELFAGTFLLAYFFKVSNDNIIVIANYHLAIYATVAVFAWLTGYWLKINFKMPMYRLGCVFNLIFFAFIWYFQEESSRYVIWLGILYGINSGLRYFGRNLLISQNVTEKKMIKFQSYLEATCNILKIVTPVVLGFFLTIDTLNKVMGVLGVLVVIDFVLSFQIKERKARHPLKFKLLPYIQKTFKNKEVRYVYYMEIFRGLTLSGVLNVVATLYIIYLFQTNFNLGSLTSFFALASIVMNILFGKYCKYQYFVRIIALCSVISVLASFIFVWMPSRETFIIYNLCYVTVARLLLIITNVNMFNIANSLKVKMLFQTEYFAVREIFLNAGRIIGFSLLLYIGFYQNFELLRYFLLFLTIGMGVMGYCSCLINRFLVRDKV